MTARFTVEYGFVNTKWGFSPMYIVGFDTRKHAEDFAKSKEDANIVENVHAWKFTKNGKKVQLW